MSAFRQSTYLDIDELQQLIGDVAKGVPSAANPNLLRNLYDDLQRAGLKLHLLKSLESHGASAADIKTLSSFEFHASKLIQILSPTAESEESHRFSQRVFLMLLQVAHSPEEVEHAIQGVQRLHSWASHYRRTHSPTSRHASTSYKTWLVRSELPRIFAERFGVLDSRLTPQERAERLNLFVARTTKLLRVPMSRATIKKRLQRSRSNSSSAT
jgi:hypothetical protein